MVSKRLRSTTRQNLLRLDRQLRQEVRDELVATGEELHRKQRMVVTRWKHKPRFNRPVITLTPALMSVVVAPDQRSRAGMIYRWIDKGTGRYGSKKTAYNIPKVLTAQSKLLKFRTGYIPKTAPVAKSQPGGMAVGGWVTKKQVRHPGIRPRKFSETFLKQLSPPLQRRIDNAIRRAIRRVK